MNLGGSFLGGLACLASLALSGACKPKETTSAPAQKVKPQPASVAVEQNAAPQDLQGDSVAALKEMLKREAVDQLRPFEFESGRLRGRAALVQAPTVQSIETGEWVIAGQYAPNGATMECLLEPEIFPMGERMGRFIEVSLDASEKIGRYQTSVGQLFLRQSKYAGLSQLVVYHFKDKPSTVGYYTMVSTHGDSWTLTCAADSPGYFETMITATKQLADSIELAPDEKTVLPEEHSIYELTMAGQRIGLQEHYLYRFEDGRLLQMVEVSSVGGKPNESFQVRNQYHLKSYQEDRLDEAVVMQYVNGERAAEFSYSEDSLDRSVRIKDLKSEGKAERVVKLDSPLLNQDQLKLCLRRVLKGRREACEVSSGALTANNELAFGVSKMKVKDKQKRVFASTANNVTGVQWFDDDLDSTRSEMKIVAGDREVPVENVRIWPKVGGE